MSEIPQEAFEHRVKTMTERCNKGMYTNPTDALALTEPSLWDIQGAAYYTINGNHAKARLRLGQARNHVEKMAERMTPTDVPQDFELSQRILTEADTIQAFPIGTLVGDAETVHTFLPSALVALAATVYEPARTPHSQAKHINDYFDALSEWSAALAL